MRDWLSGWRKGLGYAKLGCSREADGWRLVILTPPAHSDLLSIPGACDLGLSVLTVDNGTERNPRESLERRIKERL